MTAVPSICIDAFSVHPIRFGARACLHGIFGVLHCQGISQFLEEGLSRGRIPCKRGTGIHRGILGIADARIAIVAMPGTTNIFETASRFLGQDIKGRFREGQAANTMGKRIASRRDVCDVWQLRF
jgi:hypothetical protein